MSGKQTFRARCAHVGCPELAFYDRLTVCDRQDLARRQATNPWRCVRHSEPSKVLTSDNLTRSLVLTAEKSKRFPELTKLFWRAEGAADVGSGFVFGPGFKAFADDFPEGTRLVVTATAEPTTTNPHVDALRAELTKEDA